MENSDKYYWHRYIEEYNAVFREIKTPANILEFGILKGDSIRWLLGKFPAANIYGADILPTQDSWPKSDRTKYFQMDQGQVGLIEKLFNTIPEKLDLIIEDGSHLPQHQKNCLIEGLKNINSGGVYILEDLHTSHPSHPYYQNYAVNSLSYFSKISLKLLGKLGFMRIKQYLIAALVKDVSYIGPFHLLLFIEKKLKENKFIEDSLLDELSKKSLFSKDEIIFLFEKISTIQIYKRTTLPLKCYNCQTSNFDYHLLRCKCGADLYSECDSISAIIRLK
jgi:hypothetical protein